MTKLLLQCKEPEVHAHEEATGSDVENHPTDQLTRLLQNTAKSVGNSLKRPPASYHKQTGRYPLAEIGSKR